MRLPPLLARRGRPLRFLLTVLGGWTTLRATMLLWPAAPLPPPLLSTMRLSVLLPAPAAETPPTPVRTIWLTPEAHPGFIRLVVSRALPPPAAVVRAGQIAGPAAITIVPAPPVVAATAVVGVATATPLSNIVRFGTPAPPAARSRWSASAWSIVRGDGARGGIATPQLGGSQAGLRIAFALDPAQRLALVARGAAALGSVQQEAAIGLEYRLPGVPVRLVAEQRIALRNARSGPALGLVGGISEARLPAAFRLDAYGQAGVILRDGGVGYADGSVRAARPILRDRGGTMLDVGAGAWGAAQPGASRLDIGPSMALRVPVAGSAIRATLDWRQRVAGNARPPSGPALSVGADF